MVQGDVKIPPRLMIAVLTLVLIASGCTTLGWRFGPGTSYRDVGLFAAPPVVERRADGDFLAWTYGATAFFFQPGHRAIDRHLVFSLQGSSSSGDVRGRRGEVRRLSAPSGRRRPLIPRLRISRSRSEERGKLGRKAGNHDLPSVGCD